MLIQDLANAITRQEGSTQNNNPGNLWDGNKAIWPSLPHDSRGFVVFPSMDAGRAALEHDLSLKVGRGMTLTSLLNMYAPSNQNDTATYIANVSSWLKIPVDVPLNTLDQGQEPPSGDSVAANPGPVDGSFLADLGLSLPELPQPGSPAFIALVAGAVIGLYYTFRS